MADPAEFQSDFLGDDGTGEIVGAPPDFDLAPAGLSPQGYQRAFLQNLDPAAAIKSCAAAQSRPTISERRMPDIEKLEDAGLFGRTSEALLGGDALASELRGELGLRGDEDEVEEDGQTSLSLAANSGIILHTYTVTPKICKTLCRAAVDLQFMVRLGTNARSMTYVRLKCHRRQFI